MQDPRRHSTRGSSAPSQRQGTWAEVRALFVQMKDDAIRQSGLAQAEARARGLGARVLLALTIAACVLAAAVGVYGVYHFPDAPLRKAKGGYVGKTGKPRTPQEFAAFMRWKQTMGIVFPSAFALGVTYGITEARQRHKPRV